MSELVAPIPRRSRAVCRLQTWVLTLLAMGCALGCRKPLSPSSVRAQRSLPSSFSPRDTVAIRDSSSPLAVVLLTIDGVRWQEIAYGVEPERFHSAEPSAMTARALTPNLHALLDRGAGVIAETASCPGIVASGPNYLSLPGYAEIISGRKDAGCADNSCETIRVSTLIDEFARRPGVRAGDVAMFTSWPDMQRLAPSDNLGVAISAGRHGGSTRSSFEGDPVARQLLERGAADEPFPGLGDFRPDRETARLALHYVATRQPTFTWIGLGEPDEFGHRNDYDGYVNSLRQADAVIGEVASLLDKMAYTGTRTALFVTTDHGRANNFRDHGRDHEESARVWLVAGGTEVSQIGLAVCNHLYRLADIAPTIRVIADLGREQGTTNGQPIAAFVSPYRPGSIAEFNPATAHVTTKELRLHALPTP